jgi:hypothetical protein
MTNAEDVPMLAFITAFVTRMIPISCGPVRFQPGGAIARSSVRTEGAPGAWKSPVGMGKGLFESKRRSHPLTTLDTGSRLAVHSGATAHNPGRRDAIWRHALRSLRTE